jgi:class 3 adenylate cyclase
VFHGALYGLISLEFGGAPMPGRWIYWWTLIASPFAYCLGALIVVLHLRVVDRVVAEVRAGRTPEPADAALARRRAINLPVLVSRISTILWLVAASSLPVTAALVVPGIELVALLHVILVTVVMGGVSSVFIYYVNESYARETLVPLLFPEGRLAEAGAVPVTISFKLLVLLMLTIVMPVTVLSISAALGMLTPMLALFLGASFFSFGIFQAVFIERSVSRPVAHLAAQVERVARGDLEARARVVSIDHVGQLGEGFNEMVAGLRQGVFVKETFGSYVTNQVLDEILKGKIAIGGELRHATVMFSDIRGFTAMAEGLPPAAVVAFLNRYLNMMVDVVVEHRGTVDKFIGDAVMASFGVPLSAPDDALRAVRAALAMLDALGGWNAERAAAGEPPVEIGIGLCTGEVLAGSIGSSKKREYTVIGDTVNTSSRIEQLNKQLGTRLLVSEATWRAVEDKVVGRALPPVEVKGKAQPLTVYEVTGLRG